MLTLEDNPLAQGSEYRSRAISHLPNVTYLDHRLVSGPEVQAAVEQHQDEVTEIKEREEQEAAKESAAAGAAEHAAFVQVINTEGVETLVEDMVKADADWPKLCAIRGLMDGWADVVTKVDSFVQEFRVIMTDLHTKWVADLAAWEAVTAEAQNQRDLHMHGLVAEMEKIRKHALRNAAQQAPDSEAQIRAALSSCEEAQARLLAYQLESRDVVQDLLAQLESSVQESTQSSRHHITTFLSAVRDLDNGFFENCGVVALGILDKYSGDTSRDVDGVPEEARPLLADKDLLMAALSASHELHLSALDALEERLFSNAITKAAIVTTEKQDWSEAGSRARISEIVAFSDCIRRDLSSWLPEAPHPPSTSLLADVAAAA
eukprot:jgi/Botrbrau1/12658/Bobra.67_1s0023.1